jgi:putative ABC transport system permease protein
MAREAATPDARGRRRGVLAAALRVARADLLARKGQTALTALAIFAAATALVVTFALRAGIDDPFADAQHATRGADVGITRGDLSAGQVATLTNRPDVAASDTRPTAFATTQLARGPVDLRVEGLPAPDAPVDVPHVTDGRRPSAPGEVLLERSFARETGLEPGDTLRLDARAQGQDRQLKVSGLAVTTEQATFPRWDPALAWAPDATVAALGPGTRLAVRLKEPERTQAYIAQAQSELRGVAITDWHDVRDTITDQTNTNTIIIGVNTLLALIAAGFTVATVISGRVLAQRREIGLLKAIGLTPAGVVATLVGEYLLVALAAGVLGLIAGAAIAPLLLEPMASLLATPTPSALAPAPLLLSLALILLAVALCTAIPAIRAGRLNTVEALAIGRANARGKASRAARAAAALRLPATVRLGVKDAFAGHARAVLSVAALGMMVITLVAALSMEATYDKVIGDPALRAKPWDIRVEPGELTTAQALTAVRREPAEHVTTLAGLTATGPDGHEVHVRALGDGFQAFRYAVPDGRMFDRPGEAIVGRGLLDTQHLKVGDMLALRVSGVPVRVRIVGRHVEPDDDGVVAIMSASSLPAAARRQLAGAEVIAQLRPGADQRAVQRRLQAAHLNGELVSDEVRQERADVRPIVYGSSLLLVAVGLVNLLTTLLLVTRERSRDYGIFKAVGLTPRGVLAVVNAGGAVLGLIAIVAGIPVGLVIFRALMAAMSPSEGTDIVGTPGVLALALTVPVVLAVTFLASSLPARRAARTSAAIVLRAE